MRFDDLIARIGVLRPGSEWSYDGDGSTLDPVYDGDGELVSRGLEWHDRATKPPTLAELEATPTPPPPPPDDPYAVARAIVDAVANAKDFASLQVNVADVAATIPEPVVEAVGEGVIPWQSA